MKKIFFILSFISVMLTGCYKEELSDTSVFTDPVESTDSFDIWLNEKYTKPYNISFWYKYVDRETDQSYNLSPAQYDKAKALAILVRYMWLQTYETVVGADFIKTYTPRQFQLIGSNEWNTNGSKVMGTAEGGLKINLFGVNNIDLDDLWIEDDDYYAHSTDDKKTELNYEFFHTMHHEFCHILTQKKDYATDYRTISAGSYHSTDWINQEDKKVAKEGFVSAYASEEYNEDFAEMYSSYVTMSEEGWAAIMRIAGDKGRPILEQKLAIVRSYFKDSWSIDIDEVRDEIHRRTQEVKAGHIDIRNLPWD